MCLRVHVLRVRGLRARGLRAQGLRAHGLRVAAQLDHLVVARRPAHKVSYSLYAPTPLSYTFSFQNCFQYQIREKKMIHQGSLENAVHNLFPHQCMCNKDTLSLHLNLLLSSSYCSDENECKKGNNDNQSSNWLFLGIRCVASQHHLMLRISGTSHPSRLLSISIRCDNSSHQLHSYPYHLLSHSSLNLISKLGCLSLY